TIIASGHTHSGDTDIFTEKVNGKTKYFSNANQFSTPDLRLSKNIDKNPFDKPIIGIVVTPNGGILLYDPEKKYEMITIDGIKGYYGKTPSFNKPIDTSVPSDPSSGPLRLNENSPDFVP